MTLCSFPLILLVSDGMCSRLELPSYLHIYSTHLGLILLSSVATATNKNNHHLFSLKLNKKEYTKDKDVKSRTG